MKTIQGIRIAAVAASLVMAGGTAQAAPTYAFKALDNLGGSWATGAAVNTAGTVVGTATQPPNGDDLPWEPTRPARWSSVVPTDLGVVDNGPLGAASGINDAGSVVGTSSLPDSRGVRATLWSDGAIIDLGTLGGTESRAHAINNAGLIVGNSMTSGNKRVRATVWKDGTMRALKDLGGRYAYATAVSSNGLIAGYAEAAGRARHAVVWKKGVPTDLGEGQASAVNRVGTAVGSALSRTGYVHAIKWVGTEATDLGTLGGDQSFANGINDAGDVVGISSVSGCCDYHATLWHKGVQIDLNDLVDPTVRDAGWILVSATAIDRAGHITGTARNTIQDVSRAYLLTP